MRITSRPLRPADTRFSTYPQLTPALQAATKTNQTAKHPTTTKKARPSGHRTPVNKNHHTSHRAMILLQKQSLSEPSRRVHHPDRANTSNPHQRKNSRTVSSRRNYRVDVRASTIASPNAPIITHPSRGPVSFGPRLCLAIVFGDVELLLQRIGQPSYARYGYVAFTPIAPLYFPRLTPPSRRPH